MKRLECKQKPSASGSPVNEAVEERGRMTVLVYGNGLYTHTHTYSKAEAYSISHTHRLYESQLLKSSGTFSSVNQSSSIEDEEA